VVYQAFNADIITENPIIEVEALKVSFGDWPDRRWLRRNDWVSLKVRPLPASSHMLVAGGVRPGRNYGRGKEFSGNVIDK
jgi:hypothetical protein